jgi:hypothetical protein
MGKVGEVEFL